MVTEGSSNLNDSVIPRTLYLARTDTPVPAANVIYFLFHLAPKYSLVPGNMGAVLAAGEASRIRSNSLQKELTESIQSCPQLLGKLPVPSISKRERHHLMQRDNDMKAVRESGRGRRGTTTPKLSKGNTFQINLQDLWKMFSR